MLRTHSSRAGTASVVAMLLLSATLLLAACGSSGNSTSQTNASASTSKSGARSGPTAKSGAQDSGGTAAGRPTKGKGAAPPSASTVAGVPSGAALSKYAACLRKNGVTLPSAGKGSASGADTKSARYRAAVAKCAHELGGSVHVPTPKLSKAQVKKLLSKIHVKLSPDQIHTGLPKVQQPPGTGTSP